MAVDLMTRTSLFAVLNKPELELNVARIAELETRLVTSLVGSKFFDRASSVPKNLQRRGMMEIWMRSPQPLENVEAKVLGDFCKFSIKRRIFMHISAKIVI